MHKLRSLAAIAFIGAMSGANAAPSLLPAAKNVASGVADAMPLPITSSNQERISFTESAFESRLRGERDTGHLSFFVSPEQAKQGGTLRLAYSNAVSIRPDDARLSVSLNGLPAQQFEIRSPQGVSSMDVKVAAGALKPGWNVVSLTAQQHHRVDCSVDATYELWTQIDVAASGFEPQQSDGKDPASALMSVGRNTENRTELRVVMSGDIETGAQQSLAAVQTLALLLGRKDLTVRFVPRSLPEPGIELFIGDANSGWQAEEGRRLISTAPSGFSVQQLGSGRSRVIVRGVNEQAVNAALLRALTGPLKSIIDDRADPSQFGVLNADLQATHLLSELGYKAEPFAGRLFRTSFQAVMPADFYPGDYGSVTLKLNAATAPKLAPGAQLLVRVNEKAVTSHGLIDPNGTILKDKTLDIPLRAFRPGVNTVDILAELPREEDKACDPLLRDESKPRFLLLDGTSISIPALARAGRAPDLAALAGRAYPFSDSATFDVIVAAPSTAQMGTAATLLSRLAISAGKPFSVNLVVGRSATPTENRNQLVISSGQPDAVTEKSARRSSRSLDSLTTASVLAQNSDLSAFEPSDPRALLEAFQAKTVQDRDEPGLRETLVTEFQHALVLVNRWLEYREAETESSPIRNADILLKLSQAQSETRTSVVTMVSAATDVELEQGIAVLTDPVEWSSLGGGSAVVLRSTGKVVSTAADAYGFYPLADTSFSNLRRLMAAWLSDHLAFYALAVVGLVSMVGLWLGYLVPRKGVRTVK